MLHVSCCTFVVLLLKWGLRWFFGQCPEMGPELSVPWSLRPRNRTAAGTCGHGRCELPAILRVTPKIESVNSDFFAAAELSGPVLRDTARLSQRYPPIARYGVFGVSTWPIECDTPPPFLSTSPLESMQSGGAIPPPQKGYLSDTCAIPYENKANGCDTPLCDTISKGYCAIWGGISHWAAKPPKRKTQRFLQQNVCEPACGHRAHCDFAMRFLCVAKVQKWLTCCLCLSQKFREKKGT